jgi:hypothetical protein
MLNQSPVDEHLFGLWADALIKTIVRYGGLVKATQKYFIGWDRKNLRDNDFRDTLSEYIIQELEAMIGDWNQLYRKTHIAKQINILP